MPRPATVIKRVIVLSCDVKYMIDDRSHTYLIKWLPLQVNVILRRYVRRGTHHVIKCTRAFCLRKFYFHGRYTKGGIRKREKKGKLRKIQIKNRFIEFDPQQVEGQLVPRLLRMLHDVLTTLLL